MPRRIVIEKAKEQPGYEICWYCEGMGGADRNMCYGFGAEHGDSWLKCFKCNGSGLLREEYAYYLRKDEDERKKADNSS